MRFLVLLFLVASTLLTACTSNTANVEPKKSDSTCVDTPKTAKTDTAVVVKKDTTKTIK